MLTLVGAAEDVGATVGLVVGLAVGFDVKVGVFVSDGKSVGEGVTFGFGKFITPDKNSTGIRITIIRTTATAANSPRDLRGFDGGGGGGKGYCPLKSLRAKLSLTIWFVLFF
jgi:hypothetical protein